VNDKGLGKKQREALAFIRHVNGWHSYAPDVESVIRSLAERGLVEYSYNSRQFRAIPQLHTIHCDQCQMLSINGVPCHETGCPNSHSRYDADSDTWIKQRECFECGCTVDADDPCCLAPVFDDAELEASEESEEA
jgi:hypothetical protein